MERRTFLTTAGAAGAAGLPAAAAETARNAIFDLRWFRMRNGSQVSRTSAFLGKHFVPAARRAGMGQMGFFNAVIADQAPFVMSLTSYPNFQAVLEASDKMASDKEFQNGFDEYNSLSELSYIRMETSLFRAFDAMRNLVVPPARKSPRLFELRVYEANNVKASKTKVRMFNEGETKIFQRLGMDPVFFGEALAGGNLPNLTYMLAFDDLADRDKKWNAFRVDPEWEKMRAIPEYADALIVSNISTAILRGLPFSDIR
jgi:hypothetical protein